MIAWLTDTFIYTGVLIALVLVLRRPVARHFGPQMSYALWALPLLRFVMPPVVLPASFAPDGASEAMTVSTITITTDAAPAGAAVLGAEIPGEAIAPLGSVMPVPAYEPTFWEAWGGLIVNGALAVWLAGAVAFLGWRAWTYFRMREWLLDGARPVGEAGDIRLVESPAVSSPVAFGVSDKVVALPPGFMASENRAARDLAIEHELSHHRGRDLLANILAQPILALHWFNPLAWMGWRAMRRDQEAACDARVIAVRGAWERAAYGQVIASFASGQRLALAAPMACPVLGEKSIIHRLKSLGMCDVSPARRRTGRALLAGAALALPFTASISYAEAAPRDTPKPKVAKAVRSGTITIVDVPEGADPSDSRLHTRVIHKNGQTIILKTAKPLSDAEAEARVARAQAGMAKAQAWTNWGKTPTKEQRDALIKLRRTMSSEEWAEYNAEMAEHAQEWAQHGEEYGKQWEQWGKEWEKQWQENGKQWEEFGENMAKLGAAASAAPAVPAVPAVPPVSVHVQGPAPYAYSYSYSYGCDQDGNLVKIQAEPGKAAKPAQMSRCNKVADANANARRALIQARSRIQSDRGMNEDVREQVIDSLDREIDRLEENSEANS